MNVMRQNDIPSRIQPIFEVVDTVSNQRRIIVRVVLCVNARVDDMIPKISHNTQNEIIHCEVRRSHVTGSNADDLLQCILKLGHLRHDAIVVKRGKIGMAPTGFSLLANHNHLK